MRDNFLLEAEKMNKEHIRQRRWHKVVTTLACVVVFCTTYALIIPAITAERDDMALCGHEEHVHTDACYKTVTAEGALTCEKQEHTHTDACYEEVVTYTCGMEEGEEHVHTDACYKTVESYTCGHDGEEGHTHTEECISAEHELICGMEEGAHHHTDACVSVEKVLKCDLEEHTHGDACRAEGTTERVLNCEKEEHEHTSACFDAPASADEGYYCGKTAHTHTANCYFEDGSLRCTLREHTHTLECESNPKADLETRSDWEATFKNVKLSGDWAKDVLAIADSQLGYKESKVNFIADANGSKKGYTRYGDWYGNAYGDWCAMFCSFCIDYAGVKDFPLEASCSEWIRILSADAETPDKTVYYHAAGTYDPKPGDLIFFDWDIEEETEGNHGNHFGRPIVETEMTPEEMEAAFEESVAGVDHVGLVSEIIPGKNKNFPDQIKTIEGNNGSAVAYHTYDHDDVRILGYGQMPRNPDLQRQTVTAAGEGCAVEATFNESAQIPETAVLTVQTIPQDSEKYESRYTQAKEALELSDVKFFGLTNVSFVDNGQEIEPKGPVTVSITYTDAVLELTDGDGAATVHFAENGEIESAYTTVSIDENGHPTFTFTLSSFSDIANAAGSYTEQRGTFYQRVDTSNLELNSTTNYLIVSAEGNYALTYGSSPYSTKVSLTPVKGNPGYYTVNDVTNAMKWTIRSGGYIRNVGNTNYRLSMSSSLNFFETANRALTRTYNETPGTWTIANESYYLRYSDGTFSRSNSTSDTYQRNMIILKQVTTTLNIPDDVTGGSGSGGEGGTEIVQPSYTPDTTAISGAKQGDIGNITTVVPDAGENITGAYASDPSTSQIEDHFFSTIQGGKSPAVNDGKVLTDKSVIYGADDYGAFNSYDEGTFGVTLSVLGQDYQLKTADQVKIPVDVVFVLDVSGSMGNMAGNVTRREAVVNAVNSAMEKIMKDNTENRAGVVLYSSGGSTLLELDHYTAESNNQYLNYRNNKIRTAYNLRGTKSEVIPQTYGEVNGFTQSHGTYTQYGIALGAKLLQENPDTTYTTTLNQGTEYEKQVTVTRQPVIILLSDGDPTHCTSNYTDVLSGPHYGNGIYPSITNNKGIQGYYTILSANYYKRMVGIHYNIPASFYTIGMGINKTSYEDLSAKSSTGDCYKRAVLNPTAANIRDLLSNGARTTDPNSDYSAADTWSISCQMLNQLLGSSYNQRTVTVGSTDSYSQAIGVTNTVVPVISNPFSDNYSYADGAYFGNITGSELQKIFGEIISGSLNVKSYGYMLYKGTSVEIADEIGEGMEIKGTPMLRYNGQYYPLTKVGTGDTFTYVCNKTATTTDGSGVNNTQRTADLSEIEIKVTTVNGKQTISMKLPETVVPSYTPESTADWYYEELPFRLIYQVGLTDEAKTAVRNLAPGESLTYYANAWENTSAHSTQNPHQDNPYYNDVTYDDGTSRTKQYNNYSTAKTENTTGTASTSVVSEEETSPEHEIGVDLGNNGKLVFTNTAPSTVSVDLHKVDMQGNVIDTAPATFEVYTDAGLKQKFGGPYITVNGVLTIEGLEIGTPYWLLETAAPEGYNRISEAQPFTVSADGTVTGIEQNMYFRWDAENNVLLVKNSSGYELPESGGMGIHSLYALGAMLMAGALMCGFSTRRKRERGTD